jgi:hypothetical protein
MRLLRHLPGRLVAVVGELHSQAIVITCHCSTLKTTYMACNFKPARTGRPMNMPRIVAFCIFMAAALSFDGPAHAECRSALTSPEWPGIARSIDALELCEQIPVGPNQTARFQVISVDTCSFPSGIDSVTARALLTCEFGADSVFQMPSLDSEVIATVTLDTKACQVLDSDLQINGELSALLSGLENIQQTARDWAQTQLSRRCALQR